MWTGDFSVSGVVLAGGQSRRLDGLYKPLVEVGGRPMILYSVDALRPISDEILIVVRHRNQAEKVAKLLGSRARVVKESSAGPRSPLIGLMEGARVARGRVVLVSPADLPFISHRIYKVLLQELVRGDADAAVPIWPNGYLEPLVAAYARRALLRATSEIASLGILRIGSALSLMRVEFVPVAKLSKNPERALFNVNTIEDLQLARKMAMHFRQGVIRRLCSL